MPSSTPQGEYLKFYLTLILVAWQGLVTYPLHLPRHHKLFEGRVYRIPDYTHTPKHTRSSYSTHGCWMFWKVRMAFVWIKKENHSVRFQRPSQDPREEVPGTDHFRPPGEVSNRLCSVTEDLDSIIGRVQAQAESLPQLGRQTDVSTRENRCHSKILKF